jgi:nucleotide-binding universal stress UspA family protein
MFQRIIWATDGSESADKALPFVKSLVSTHSAGLTVIHCEEHMVGPRAGFTVYAEEPEIQNKIKAQVEELEREGFDVSLRVASSAAGGAAHAIADIASQIDADLIVVGTRGHTALGGLLLGSCTQRLLHIGVCPVFAVPAVARPATTEREPAEAVS